MAFPLAAAAVAAGATPLAPGADGIIVLPAGVSLDDITVQGRDLIVHAENGQTYIIIDGAVFVPTLVIDGVSVPPLNLAALLIGAEVQPAAGQVQSSGNNFADPVGDIQDAYKLGDLLPYTELKFDAPRAPEVLPSLVDREPTTIIITPDNPAGAVAATASVNEAGLAPRGLEPAGSAEIADGNPGNNSNTGETTNGTIVFDTPDGLQSVTINGIAVTQVGQPPIQGAHGSLVITSIAPGAIGYSYTLADNTTADPSNDQFTVTVTDSDGDQASAMLTVTIVDDVPTARADSDTVAAGTFGPEGGNVITGVGTAGGTGGPGADTQGADGASLTRIASVNAPANVDTSFDGSGNLVVNGQYGVLSIKANGEYTYTRNAGTPGGVSDAFTYTLTDGDGDTSPAVLTINIGNGTPTITGLTSKLDGGDVSVNEDDLPAGSDTSKESLTQPGDFTVTSPDGIGSLVIGGHTVITNGVFTAASWTTPLGNTISITAFNAATGVVSYTYTLDASEAHTAVQGTNSLFEDFTVTLTDADTGVANSTLSVNIIDDIPAVTATPTQPSLTVDETTLATNASASFAGVFTSSFGADGAGTVTYALGITGGNGTASGLIDVATGSAIVLVNNAGVIEGHVATVAGALAFTVSADGSGNVTLDQIRALSHPNANDPNDAVTLSADNLITLTATVTDKDGDHLSAVADIGSNLQFRDDGPTSAINETGQGVSIDESAGLQADSNDTAGPLTVFNTVASKGADPDMAAQFATNALAIVNSTGTALGADGGTSVFSLKTSDPLNLGVDSGLNTTNGTNIFLFTEGGLVVGRVGATAGAAAAGPAAFALSIDATGHISMVQYLSIEHTNTATPDDSVSITDGALLAVVTSTDGDGDTNAASTAIGNLISFQDSGPIMTSASNINIQNSGDVAHTGAFAFDLGADGAPTSNDVISIGASSATVNGAAVTNYVLTAGVENATTASYSFSFDYPTGAGTIAHETGTLVFNKAAGTYTVDLDNPISGFSILATSGAPASAFVNYNLGTSTTSNGPSEVAVVQLDTNFFLQFSGVYDKTGSDHQSTTVGAAGSYSPTTGTFAGLDLFTQANATVTVASTAAGVAGNTIQGGEVLDFNLYTTNHTGVLGTAPDQSATSMFISLDGIGTSEDMIIILKLLDTVTHQYTEQALMVQNGDIIVAATAAQLVGTAYAAVSPTGNNGLIVIEGNDYQNGNANLVIVGAQIAGSDDGVTGLAANFKGTIGAGGGSDFVATQAFSTDVSDAPFKIQSIGFVLQTTTNQNAHLSFDVTIHDGDGDTVTQTITADVTAAIDSATAISLSAAVTTVAPVVLDLNGDGVHFLATDGGVHYDYGTGSVATAWAAPDDGILIRDANGDGTITDASEFVFGGNGLTDLQALAAQYGSELNANDADFGKFGVWQDANGNGVADAGEFKSLADLGIASVKLTSDGVSYNAANGDVIVHGTTTYTKTDGTIGTAADVSFATDADRQARTADFAVVAAAASGVVAGSIVAATIAVDTNSSPAPAANDDSPAPAAPASLDPSSTPTEAHPDTSALLGSAPAAPLAPQPEIVAKDDAGADAKATNLAAPADHGSDPAPVADQSSAKDSPDHASAFDFGGNDGHVMDALLAVNLPVPVKDVQPSADTLVAVQHALTDTAAAQTVDAVIEHFAAAQAPTAGTPAPAVDPSALASLLLAHVGPTDPGFHAMPPIVDDHSAALAAA